MVNVLFVCTGNIFRSMSAEYCLKDFVKKHKLKNINVSSAGTTAKIQPINPCVLRKLLSFGIEPREHVQRRLTQKIINENDLIVAMSTDHQEFIKENFGIDVPLFNEVCFGVPEALLDIHEAVEDWMNKMEESNYYFEKVVTHIHENIGLFANNIKKYVPLQKENAKSLNLSKKTEKYE